MTSVEVKQSGETITLNLRQFEGIGRAEYSHLEEMTIARAIGFRAELDAAIEAAKIVKSAKVDEIRKKIEQDIQALQKQLIELGPVEAAPQPAPPVPQPVQRGQRRRSFDDGEMIL